MPQLLLASAAQEPLHQHITTHSHLMDGKFLAIIYVGDNSASKTYVHMKKRFGEKYHISTRIYGQKEHQTFDSLSSLIRKLNADVCCAGIMIQLPLPDHLQSHATALCSLIDPSKDVDGLGGQLLGLSAVGVQNIWPATPGGIITLLDHYGYGDLHGQVVVILGQSNLLGKPLALACINRGATIITANSDTNQSHIRQRCQQADIICSCTGVIHLIGAEYTRNDQSQIIIDAGFGHLNGRSVGDVNFDEVSPRVRAITPVPGGVGPMTVAQLFANLITLITNQPCL